jgi:hypothetical protein
MKILNVPIRYIYTLYVYTTPECILYPECTLAKWRKPDQLAARLSGALVCPAPTHPSATSRPHHLPQAVAGHPFLSILKKNPRSYLILFSFSPSEPDIRRRYCESTATEPTYATGRGGVDRGFLQHRATSSDAGAMESASAQATGGNFPQGSGGNRSGRARSLGAATRETWSSFPQGAAVAAPCRVGHDSEGHATPLQRPREISGGQRRCGAAPVRGSISIWRVGECELSWRGGERAAADAAWSIASTRAMVSMAAWS